MAAKVLIIGLGSIARKHIRALRSLQPDAEISALRSNASAGIEEHVQNVFSWDDVSGDTSFALVCSPTSKHSATVTTLVQKKIPFLLEKPISHTLNGLDLLKSEIEEQGLKTYVACNLRFMGCLRYVKDQLEKSFRTINEVNIYCGSYLPDWRPGTNFREGYSAQEFLGGGVHLDLFHELDYAVWLFGMPEASDKLLRSRSTLRIDAVDYAQYRLYYPGFVASVTLNYFRRTPKRSLEIVFEDGTWYIDLLSNQVSDSSGRVLYQSDKRMLDTYIDQMAYFLDYLTSPASSLNSFSESADILKICLENGTVKK